MESIQLSFLDGKVCRLCHTLQPLDNFFFRSDSGKHRTECKACLSALHQQRYTENHDAIRAKQKERHHARKNDPDYIEIRRNERLRNRDKSLATKAKYRADHRDELNAKEHQRDHLNRDEINQKTREKRRNNPDHFREIKKRSYVNTRAHQLQKAREWRLANPDRKRKTGQHWYQNNKKRVHDLSRRWRATNRDQYRVSARMYQHKRRAKMRGQSFHWRDWLAMCNWFDGVCLCCGAAGALTLDHVIPVEHGGANLIENLQPLCLHCNTSKGAHHSTDYRDPDRLAQFLASIGH